MAKRKTGMAVRQIGDGRGRIRLRARPGYEGKVEFVMRNLDVEIDGAAIEFPALAEGFRRSEVIDCALRFAKKDKATALRVGRGRRKA